MKTNLTINRVAVSLAVSAVNPILGLGVLATLATLPKKQTGLNPAPVVKTCKPKDFIFINPKF